MYILRKEVDMLVRRWSDSSSRRMKPQNYSIILKKRKEIDYMEIHI